MTKKLIAPVLAFLLCLLLCVLLTACGENNSEPRATNGKGETVILVTPTGEVVNADVDYWSISSPGAVHIYTKDGTKYTTGIENVLIIREVVSR